MLTELASRMMSMLDGAKQVAVQNYDYSKVDDQLSKLRAAVEEAIRRDDDEANGFWMELGRLARHGFNYGAERNRFYAEANNLKLEARTALRSVEVGCRATIGVHANVPAELMREQRAWASRASEVRDMQTRARALQAVPGWEGDARNQYVVAAGVQAAALEELSGIMESTGESCAAGALLNRGLFFSFGQTLSQATSRIRSAPGAAGDQYYLRTATARAECTALVQQLNTYAKGAPAAGAMGNLVKQCATTITMPNLLVPGKWPTGTSAAGVQAADTSGGVPPDRTADVNTPGGGGSCVPGVDL